MNRLAALRAEAQIAAKGLTPWEAFDLAVKAGIPATEQEVYGAWLFSLSIHMANKPERSSLHVVMLFATIGGATKKADTQDLRRRMDAALLYAREA